MLTSEIEALRGLPWLARMIYVFAIRPYVDAATGVAGKVRRISMRGILEDLEVWPCQRVTAPGPPTKQAIRSAIWQLERRGLIRHDGLNVFLCLLYPTGDYQAQKNYNTDYNRITTGLQPDCDSVKPATAKGKQGDRKPDYNRITTGLQHGLQHTSNSKDPYRGFKSNSLKESMSSFSENEKLDPPSASSSKAKYSPDDLDLAQWMHSTLIAVYPKLRKPDLAAWAQDIRRIRELDLRPVTEIRDMFTFAHQHDFWSRNVLSPKTLRKQWDRLEVERVAAVRRRACPGRPEGDPMTSSPGVEDTLRYLESII